MAWTKPGPGRPLGTSGNPRSDTMRRVAEARTFCQNIVDNDEYRKALLARAVAGTLHPQVETMLFYYVFGKPSENIMLSKGADVDDANLPELTEDELKRRIGMLAEALKEDKKAGAALAASAEAQREAEIAVQRLKRVN